MMDDNDGTIPQQIAHLEGIAPRCAMPSMKRGRDCRRSPATRGSRRQVNALERLLKGLLAHSLGPSRTEGDIEQAALSKRDL
jgi:hypothetical protein